MLIAQEKKRNNIAEYLLYMFQVEDTLRACGFDITRIEQQVINQFHVAEKVKQDIRNWYANLIVMMHEEEIKEQGHLQFLMDIINEMNILHLHIIQQKHDRRYIEIYQEASLNIIDFRKKLANTCSNEVEVCLTGLYALLLLRLQKKVVTDETLRAMQTFSNFLAILSERYMKLQ